MDGTCPLLYLMGVFVVSSTTRELLDIIAILISLEHVGNWRLG